MTDCLFCKIVNGELSSFKIYEDEIVYAFLDINPNSIGHTLIIPKTHYQDFFDIDMDTLMRIMESAKKVMNLLEEKLKPTGFTLIQNNGTVQEVKHFHLHIKPCYLKKMDAKSVEEVFQILTQ